MFAVDMCYFKKHFLSFVVVYQASIQTQIHHDAEEPERVDGYQEPGSYRRLIRYGDMYKEQFDELIRRADSCQQYIKFECHNTRLLADPGKLILHLTYLNLYGKKVFLLV